MPSIWVELKRRKVFQVAAVYAVVAWLTIQIVDVIGEPLNLPDWFDTFVIVLFGVGFPIAIILAWAFDLTPDGIEVDPDARIAADMPQPPGQRHTLIIQGLVLLAVAFLVVDQYLIEPRPSVSGGANAAVRPISGVRRFEIPLGETGKLGDSGLETEIAISRDGTQLAYLVVTEAGPGGPIFLRSLDRLDATQITTGRRPFFSDDGQRLGVFGGVQPTGSPGSGLMAGSSLRTVSLNGGPAQVHLDTQVTRKYGGSWHGDSVVFSESSIDELLGGSLYRLSISGTSKELLLSPEPGKAHVYPQFLPSGDAVLFTIRDVDGSAREGSVAVLSLKTGEHRELIEGGFAARYAPTGHLVFARSGALWAVKFDPETLEVSGNQTPVVDGVQMDGDLGGAVYGFSDNGLLVYMEGSDVGSEGVQQDNLSRLAILGINGSRVNLPMQARAIERVAVSPDGASAAIVISESENKDIYVYDDFTRVVPRRLTFDSGEDNYPLWTPDGERVVFWSSREGGGIFEKSADGTGQVARLTTSAKLQRPVSFSPDGSELFFVDGATPTGVLPKGTLYRLPMSDDGEAEPLLGTGMPELFAQLSPDGRWLAYSSGDWPQVEVYVEPYPNPAGSKWQVSTDGYAVAPIWVDGDNLQYFNYSTSEVMRVTIETDPVFRSGAPELLWSLLGQADAFSILTAGVLPDGLGVLAAIAEVTDTTDTSQSRLLVVENWFEELEAIASQSN
jgi:hypothetical protein